jgi:hypothetical protein
LSFQKIVLVPSPISVITAMEKRAWIQLPVWIVNVDYGIGLCLL